jgi:Fe2+ or Zn2+ uptake regulation protein
MGQGHESRSLRPRLIDVPTWCPDHFGPGTRLPERVGYERGSIVADLLERLQRRGWRLTAQRRAVAEVLRGEHVHLSAEAIHDLARIRLPEISIATVYNTLNELVDMGELVEVSAGGGPKRYDPNVGRSHQHLVCLRCGELHDVLPTGEQALDISTEQRYGYRLVDVEIVFRGLCPSCVAQQSLALESADASPPSLPDT